jgi:hypothetical protein
VANIIQILKAVTAIMATAIAFFWLFMRNPAIAKHAGMQGRGGINTLVYSIIDTCRKFSCSGPIIELDPPWGSMLYAAIRIILYYGWVYQYDVYYYLLS